MLETENDGAGGRVAELPPKRFDFRGSFRVESAERTPTAVLEMRPLYRWHGRLWGRPQFGLH